MFEITTEPDDFNAVTAALEAKGYVFAEAAIEMVPQNYIKQPQQQYEYQIPHRNGRNKGQKLGADSQQESKNRRQQRHRQGVEKKMILLLTCCGGPSGPSFFTFRRTISGQAVIE